MIKSTKSIIKSKKHKRNTKKVTFSKSVKKYGHGKITTSKLKTQAF